MGCGSISPLPLSLSLRAKHVLLPLRQPPCTQQGSSFRISPPGLYSCWKFPLKEVCQPPNTPAAVSQPAAAGQPAAHPLDFGGLRAPAKATLLRCGDYRMPSLVDSESSLCRLQAMLELYLNKNCPCVEECPNSSTQLECPQSPETY